MTNPAPPHVDTEISTTRLLLRCPTAADGADILIALRESLTELRAWPASLPWAMEDPSPISSAVFCRKSVDDFSDKTALVYFAFDDRGTFVASTSLHNINWSVPSFELGFWCRSTYSGKGYAKEAVQALVRYAFESLGANRVYAHPDERNTRSRALCEAVGLQLEGVLKNERITPDGELRNTCVYAATRSAA